MKSVILILSGSVLLSISGCKKAEHYFKSYFSKNYTANCIPGTRMLLTGMNFDNNLNDISGNNTSISSNNISFDYDKDSVAHASGLFSGSTSYVQLNGSYDYPERSISVWFKATSYPGGSNAGIDDAGILMGYDNAKIKYGAIIASFEGQSGARNLRLVMGHNTITTTLDMSNNQPFGWHHLAMVQTSSSVIIYLDGIKKYASALSSYYNSVNGLEAFMIGCGRFTNGRFFHGDIDQFRFYNRALSQCEVEHLYNHY